MPKALKVLSIDGWNGPEGWHWNSWRYLSAECPADLLGSPRRLLSWFRKVGLLSASSAGKVMLDYDQYNVVVLDRSSREPLFAVEHGSEES